VFPVTLFNFVPQSAPLQWVFCYQLVFVMLFIVFIDFWYINFGFDRLGRGSFLLDVGGGKVFGGLWS
jgi:hypothetical protein